MQLKVSHYILLLLILLSLFAIGQSLSFKYWEAMILPILFSAIIFIASVYELIRELKNSKSITQRNKDEMFQNRQKSEINLREFTKALSWIVGFVLGTYLLGFVISIPLFIIIYLRVCKQGWFVSVFMAVIMTVSEYVLF